MNYDGITRQMMEEKLYGRFLQALDAEDWERCEKLARYINLVNSRHTGNSTSGGK